MKLPLFLLVLCSLSMGCVVGPEEVAAEKQAKKDTGEDQAKAAEMAAAAEKESSEKDSGLKTVSGTSEPPAAAASSEDFQKTNNGLKYKIIEPGTGKRPTKSSTVLCHYRGWLDNGREFDSSYKSGEPVEFPLNGVIPGWTEGLQLIQEGGKIELEIPSRLGYGERGMPGAIPPNSRLHFTIELLKVK
ncbi:FKBP-type peptidyl-prolyl cis-trans isomerase [Planctomicrobium piriforme]|uniref:Peptidyl-prolyl cis-trans isomerase n=1 Tax=Planctomicrobium piriforme TaxID=1576369 RepID=A0A1I3J9E9_9PLAN|nr:FKBP-type peptidyl-prolyl cis-trans isomerase [Planctomicrobium piriforme]SFI56931.1 FKBP-type peptidyl-prolyl cis-trans isomerase FkpA [Planctomicrobium piriforme]